MAFVNWIQRKIAFDKRRLSHFEKIASSTVGGRLNCRWNRRRECLQYYYREPGDDREHYVRQSPNLQVWRLQRKRFATEMVRVLQNNIDIMQKLAGRLLPDSEADVLERLPRAYRPNVRFRPLPRSSGKRDTGKYSTEKRAVIKRDTGRRSTGSPDVAMRDVGIRGDQPNRGIPQSENDYKREELTIQTSFGLWVRSRGELAIAEMLYSLNIEFFYERALTLDVIRTREHLVDGRIVKKEYETICTYYPDFTIILPSGKIFYWEHKGLLKREQYAERDRQKTIDYNKNGIFQPHNYIVTEDGPSNDLDLENIKKVVAALLLDWY